MFRLLLRRIGFWKSIFGITLISIVASVLISSIVINFDDGSFSWSGLGLSILVPAIISPLFSYLMIRLVFELEDTEERLRQLSFADDLNFTISIGIKTFNRNTADLDQVLRRADEALYIAKRNGKNMTVSADGPDLWMIASQKPVEQVS